MKSTGHCSDNENNAHHTSQWLMFKVGHDYKVVQYVHFECGSRLPFCLVSYVGERLWWPIQSPNKGRQKKAKGREKREIRSSLLILDLKDGKL